MARGKGAPDSRLGNEVQSVAEPESTAAAASGEKPAAKEQYGFISPRSPLWLLPILIVAAVLRLTGLAWDDYHHYHPDERYIAWVATSVTWPTNWTDAWQPHRSTLNPFYWPAKTRDTGVIAPENEPRRFAYGHVPLYAGVLAAGLVDWVGSVLRPLLPASTFLSRDLFNGADRNTFDHLTIVGRLLTALLDVGAVALLYLLGRRLFDPVVGLLAAAFLALDVLHIQLAHFWTVDPYLTFFALAAIYCLVLALDHPRFFWPGAVFVGLAVGSKFAGIFLLLPLALFCWWHAPAFWPRARRLLLAVFLAALTFALTNPFALLDFTCQVVSPAVRWGPISLPAINWGNCFLENLSRQSGMVNGSWDVGFARQYAGTTPFLYPLEMLYKWGLGPLLAVVAVGGLLWLSWRAWARRQCGEWLLLAWVVPFFLATGGLYVKFMRYLQPIVPLLLLMGAAWLLHGFGRRARRPAVALTLVATALYALAFANMYRQPHPWTTASAWIFRHVPAGATVLTEQWDEPLPTGMVIDGVYHAADEYESDELTWLTGPDEADDEAKLAANLARLANADYVVIASNRVYGVVPRLPQRYPLSGHYARLLFSGQLGYDVVFVTDRAPNLGGVTLRPDSFAWPRLTPPEAVQMYLTRHPTLTFGRADESFTVYDQPLAFILANRQRLSAAAMRQLFTTNEPLPTEH